MSLEKYLKKEKGFVTGFKKNKKKDDSEEIVDDGDKGDKQIVSKKALKPKKREYLED